MVLEDTRDTRRRYFPQGFPELEDKGRKVVYNKDLIGEDKTGGRNIAKGVLHLKDKVLKCFLSSRKETLECSLSLQIQGGHTSLSLQRQDKKETLPQQVFLILGD